MTDHGCPALLLAAPASGQGKTTLTAGLARHHRNQGRRVRVFKTGPDYLDPMILEQASGAPVYQLDLWMVGEAGCRTLLRRAAEQADIILIEGVMGLFDGTPSSADLAQRFGIPVLAFIDAAAMAQTFAALAHGLASFRPELTFFGVVANRVGSPWHASLLSESLPAELEFLGVLPQQDDIALPQRHLGLLQASEIADLDARIEATATLLADTGMTRLPPEVAFAGETTPAPPPLLRKTRIGVAHDHAFSFLYPANLDLLRDMGAELVTFSPLQDSGIPDVDSLLLPGGYPELHLEQLSDNRPMMESLRAHADANRPVYAECGGMLYLLESLTDRHGKEATMARLLPGRAVMQRRLVALGMQSVQFPTGTLRGHTFHHSRMDSSLQPWLQASRQRGDRPGEALYRDRNTIASYVHLYLPGCPQAAAQLFQADGEQRSAKNAS